MSDDTKPEAAPPKAALIPMRGPKGCAATLSHAGQSYEADKTGLFSVPVHAVDVLKRHGFRVAGGEKPEG